ncbi:uncharacterized protein BJ171DRAFT_507215 [Polychytrium aggregatum]|uniref:uncharacterized protein n=1 Tax=Polychytrium aggregatum TaxID=110093 RepID=UPI0022FE0873|nr:uncharacterized protein BJ171DRAFT_507215 [Polychytrium aggregatum]KAI9203971.1 hypothetical protein BJ171DRAFT_507215 [Polychytrium aggregatum]
MSSQAAINSLVDLLASKLKRLQVRGSYNVAIETAGLLRKVTSASRWNSLQSLISTIKDVGRRLIAARPIEIAVANIVRRVLYLAREEYEALVEQHINTHGSADTFDLNDRDTMSNFRGILAESIAELVDELTSASANISGQALEHIHSNEIIMTIGYSQTVEAFLKEAAKVRKFQVIVAETAPHFEGHQMALALSTAGIDTTVISDSAIFAVMARVNKVLLGTHAVTANGGLVTVGGSLIMASAAKHHSTPVVVCAGLYKLSPLYPYDTDIFNLCVSPDPVYNFQEGDMIDKIDVINPFFDYVSPELVNLFITNVGSHPPSYIYRLLTESYSSDDNEL